MIFIMNKFGHVERIGECRLTYEIYKASVDGTIGRGCPRRTTQINCILKKGQNVFGNNEHAWRE